MGTSVKNKNLVASLGNFGLNPKEWIFTKKKEGLFQSILLINKEDPNFQLMGLLGKKGWTHIELVSL